MNSLITYANKYYTENKPYDKKSKNRQEVIINLFYLFKEVSIFYRAITPELGDYYTENIAKPEIEKVILYKKII